MKKRSAPELYEVLKRGNVDIRKPSLKEEDAVKEDSTAKSSDSNVVPLVTLTPIPERVYPKLKSSFVKKPGSPQNKEFKLSYNAVFFGILIGIIILAIVFIMGRESSPSKDTSSSGTVEPAVTDGQTSTADTVRAAPAPAPAPAATQQKWMIEVVSYDNTTVGKYSADRMLKLLQNKQITNSSVDRNHRDSSQISVYIGPYGSRSEAEEAFKSIKNANRDIRVFSISEVVQIRR
ncbi:MAG: SPOR domain-containing protein [Planctomycetes bacterium]|nr:SPOR domain-containing protein [Planctomycetota bacterium]